MITGKYPPDSCDGDVCQMPEDIVSPGNKWFSNDLSDNDTIRKTRDAVFEDGEIARESSWPWVVAITGNPKLDYCHVEVVPSAILCEILNFTDLEVNLKHAEYNDFINLDEIQEMAETYCVETTLWFSTRCSFLLTHFRATTGITSTSIAKSGTFQIG